ncbi:hypothetical protein MBLNU459_g8506t1 [Dothideomycetes sp. NU459]
MTLSFDQFKISNMALGKIFPFLFILFCALLTPGMGFQQVPKGQDLSVVLSTQLGRSGVTESVQYMVDTMQSVQNIPSCYKMASAALLNSCSELDQSSILNTETGTGTMLEKAKTIYATRLAICELLEAKVPIPDSCSQFRPSERTGRMTGFRIPFVRSKFSAPNTQYQHYDDTTEKFLDSCTADLHSEPQWWTSYSNAKQNAVVMCHAVRAQLDKDDSVEMFSLMADAVLKGSEGLSDAANKFKAFEENWKATTDGMKAFHMALNDDFDELRLKVAQHWSNMENSAVDLGDRIRHMRETTSDVVNDLDNHLLQNRLAHAQVMQGFDEIQGRSDEVVGLQDLSISQLKKGADEIVDILSGNLAIARELQMRMDTVNLAMSQMGTDANETRQALLKVQEEVDNLPRLSSLLFGFSNTIVGSLFKPMELLVFVVTGSSLFACLDTWGPFRPRAATVLSLAVGFVSAYTFPFIAPLCMMPGNAFKGAAYKLYTPMTPLVLLIIYAASWVGCLLWGWHKKRCDRVRSDHLSGSK